jgi:flavin-dependent dehydrogenase
LPGTAIDDAMPSGAHEHVVVGAGPAGCFTALELLRRGAGDVLLLERRPRPSYERYHDMCAGGISDAGLSSLGIDARGITLNVITMAEEHWPGDTVISGAADGRIIDRRLLLDGLKLDIVDRGGVVMDEHVAAARGGDDGVCLSCSSGRRLMARTAYGADGGGSVLRRDLFRWRPQAVVLAEQHLVPRQMDAHKLIFHFTSATAPKYQWTFPCGPFSHIGFPFGSMAAPDGSMLRAVRPIPVGADGAICGARACLIGDAACQANPLTFGGIRNGMEAGRMAARASLEGRLEEYGARWAGSPLADGCFLDAFHLLKGMDDRTRAEAMAPLRPGAGIIPVMRALMNDEAFRALYRAHVRKALHGW